MTDTLDDLAATVYDALPVLESMSLAADATPWHQALAALLARAKEAERQREMSDSVAADYRSAEVGQRRRAEAMSAKLAEAEKALDEIASVDTQKFWIAGEPILVLTTGVIDIARSALARIRSTEQGGQG